MINSQQISPTCPWCDGDISLEDIFCPQCASPVKKVKALNEKSKTNQKPVKSRTNLTPPTVEESKKLMEGRKTCLGVDPGARYTALNIRDENGKVYLSSTYYRNDNTTEIEWVWECVEHVKKVYESYKPMYIAVETTVDPKGYVDGKLNPLNPKDIIRTALVVGGIAQEWKDEIILVRPRKNGSQSEYPKEIKGVRPKDLPGFVDPKVKTRKHERSAYDVAGNALFEKR